MRLITYVSERQENSIWIAMAWVWAVGGALAWLTALLFSEQFVASASVISLLAMLVGIISIVLRLPILSDPPHTSQSEDHLVWLLSCFASVNWLGFLALGCASLSDALPAIVILILAEIWIHSVAWPIHCLPWLHAAADKARQNLIALSNSNSAEKRESLDTLGQSAASLAAPTEFKDSLIGELLQVPSVLNREDSALVMPGVSDYENSATSSQSDVPPDPLFDQSLASTTLASAEQTQLGGRANIVASPSTPADLGIAAQHALSTPEQQHIPEQPSPVARKPEAKRQTIDSVDEDGRRYLSGEVQVVFEPEHVKQSVVIAFFPAFQDDPEVDFECDDEKVSIRLVNCTPTGMRLSVRRDDDIASASFTVAWYATEMSAKPTSEKPSRTSGSAESSSPLP